MTLAVGTDVVSVARFEESLQRTLGLVQRLFTEAECARLGSPPATHRLAARFAAKEAVAKALGAPTGLSWHECEVLIEPDGRPTLRFSGAVAARAAELGLTQWVVSMTHDGGVALATVVATGAHNGV